jgi:tetratricopeptide (TPR) repeat protein
MAAILSKLKATVAATLALVTISLPFEVSAAGPDREAELLESLSNSAPGDASAIARELESSWDKSGSAAMDLLLRRGRDAMERGDFREAIEHLTALTDHAPGFAQGWYERSRAYFASDLMGPAVADLERALSLNPNDYNAIYGLGVVLEHFNDPEAAHEAYTRAQAIHPHHEEVTKALERLNPAVAGKEL